MVVYDSTYGNTEQIARAIADGLAGQHSTRVIPATGAAASDAEGIELLVVGGPTQRRRASTGLRQFLRSGAYLLAEPESFFMDRDRPPEGGERRHELEHLEPGEPERARAWAVRRAREPVAVRSS